MVFIVTLLSKIPGVKKSKYIRARILRRMDQWTYDLVGALVKDTYGTGKARRGRVGVIREQYKEEHASMAYKSTMKAGHLRAAVRQATDQWRGGALHVNITDPNSGMLVLDVLRLKHVDLQEVDLYHPDCSSFKAYPARPKVLPLDITYSDVEITVRKMGGSGGPRVSD